MAIEQVTVPDIGGADDVELIEICVAIGDHIELEQSLIVLESDKASMEVPSPVAGKLVALHVKEGDTLAMGALLADIESDAQSAVAEEAPVQQQEREQETEKETALDSATQPAAQQSEPVSSVSASEIQAVLLPDIGDENGAEIIEILVAIGDELADGGSILVLESDKASMEVPSPAAGVVKAIHCKQGEQLKQGDLVIDLEVPLSSVAEPEPGRVATATAASNVPPASKKPLADKVPSANKEPSAGKELSAGQEHSVHERPSENGQPSANIYAGPAVRKIAREFGVDLALVKGSGPRGRVLKEDVQSFVKQSLQGGSAASAVSGSGIPPLPDVDFSAFGDVEMQAMSRMHKLTAKNMTRNWLNIPHVTQFDDTDITDLEDFRASLKKEMERQGVKLSPLPFLVKAAAVCLSRHRSFNASLHADGEHIVFKKYCHIGIAVDTPAGLMVPVIRDADKKSVWAIGAEIIELAGKAKERKLKPNEMQGSCFTISSLGNIGGQGFTPMINAPEVAILGVSRMTIKPIYQNGEFVPRKMLPLSLSYDHRAVNGSDAGRFMTELCGLLTDIRLQLL